jgi:polyisoprenoid-binding protein YceI
LTVWAIVLGGAAFVGLLGRQSVGAVQAPELANLASDWQVETGSLQLTITQLGNPVIGNFSEWTAAIEFDEPEGIGPAGQVEVLVSVPSLTLGSVTGQALGADFFDADQYPQARFVGEIEKSESGYVATGPLTIRDQSSQITLPFDLQLEGDSAVMSGAITLQRLDFGIGRGQPDEGALGFSVTVNVELEARRQISQ